MQAVAHAELVALALHATHDDVTAGASEEVSLEGSAGKAETQLATDDRCLQQTPAVTTHKAPGWK